MKVTIDIHYYEGSAEYPKTTQLVNKAYAATGFIPSIGDRIFIHEEDVKSEEDKHEVVTVVSRGVLYGFNESNILLKVSDTHLLVALIDDEHPKLPSHFYKAG